MKNILMSFILAFGFLCSVSIFAEVDNNPCKADKDTFCSACKEDKTCVKECMKTNEAKLSQTCQTHRASQKQNSKK
ncbi:MAG: hypothetical protein WCQ47_06860 [bacterium]